MFLEQCAKDELTTKQVVAKFCKADLSELEGLADEKPEMPPIIKGNNICLIDQWFAIQYLNPDSIIPRSLITPTMPPEGIKGKPFMYEMRSSCNHTKLAKNLLDTARDSGGISAGFVYTAKSHCAYVAYNDGEECKFHFYHSGKVFYEIQDVFDFGGHGAGAGAGGKPTTTFSDRVFIVPLADKHLRPAEEAAASPVKRVRA